MSLRLVISFSFHPELTLPFLSTAYAYQCLRWIASSPPSSPPAPPPLPTPPGLTQAGSVGCSSILLPLLLVTQRAHS